MAQYAIAFDLDTKAMKAANITNAERTTIYQQEIPEALKVCGFTTHLQGSLYALNVDHDQIAALMQLHAKLQQNAPNFCKFVKRVHVFRMEEWSDVTPIIAGKPAAPIAADEIPE